MAESRSPLVRHLDELADEGWDDPARGSSTWRTLFSRPVTPTAALTTGVTTVPVGGELATHRHTTVESYFLLEGTGVLRLGDDEHPVRPGSAVLVPPSVLHGLRNTGSEVLRFFYVFAADSFDDVAYVFDADG